MSQELTTPTPALSAEQAAWLADTMARNRARFGGWSMEADAGDSGADAGDAGANDAGDQSGEDGQQNDDGPEAGDDNKVQRANREAARYRTEKNALQQQLQEAQTAQQEMLANIAKALGIAPEDSGGDPAKQVSELTGQVQSLTSDKAALEAQLIVHDLASGLNAKASALLDSKAFTNALAELDPAEQDYRTKVADAIKEAVSKNPAYRSGAGKGGAELNPDDREQAKRNRAKGLGAAISGHYKS